ncbi:hypothetical protein [Methanoregula sp. UBA64]|jgi:hypothetical protein|uniref:hypothetical protein n=1 Tax=Methanoregula sp. UBA64 TaxID=1915554 RepID=UPI0025F10C13|nr:hypothetical protein [Methanoregula sp. UBA64]
MDHDTLCPCQANALFGIKKITVAGKPVGINGLPAAFAAVDAKKLTRDADITAELMRKVEEENYIPPALAGEYAAALLAEYKKVSSHR